MNEKVLLIGIVGGSGSGKTTITNNIINEIGRENVVIIEQDAYYKDQSHLNYEERAQLNFDHPDAFDNDLLKEHLRALMRGEGVHKPVYNFVTHSRDPYAFVDVAPAKVIIVEGILVYYDEVLRNMLNIRIYIDTESDIRIIRRIRRDMVQRGRSLESILHQYETMVRPAHSEFVEPTKRFAHIIIPEGGHNKIALEFLTERLRKNL